MPRRISMRKRIKAKPNFILILAFISILGFISNILQITFNLNLGEWTLSLTSILLGIGLVIESQIRAIVKKKQRLNANTISHIVTSMVGSVILVSGVLALPIIPIQVTGILASIIGFTNFIAVVVILYEVFIID